MRERSLSEYQNSIAVVTGPPDAVLQRAMAESDELDPVVTTRVPKEWLARADALAQRLEQNEEVRAFAKPSRSMVVRLALLRGLDLLERQYGAGPAPVPPAKGRRKR